MIVPLAILAEVTASAWMLAVPTASEPETEDRSALVMVPSAIFAEVTAPSASFCVPIDSARMQAASGPQS